MVEKKIYMKKSFLVASLMALVAALLLMVAAVTSCKKDNANKPRGAEYFVGTAWKIDRDLKIYIYFHSDGVRTYTLDIYGKISAQELYSCIYENDAIKLAPERVEVGEVIMSHAFALAKIENQKLSFYKCDNSWNPIHDTPDVVYVKIDDFNPDDRMYANAPDAVDLGSMMDSNGNQVHVLWASRNLGADSEKGSGTFFSWGETSPKLTYTENDYTYTESPEVLPADRDAAAARLGSLWRMPTASELDALACTVNNTTDFKWEEETVDGVKGIRVKRLTGAFAGNNIFLPFVGYYYDTLKKNTVGAYYRSSMRHEDNYDKAVELDIESVNYVEMTYDRRCFGQPVRPVKEII